MSDYLQFRTTALGRHEGKTHIVIVGAGIIGVCTAYFLVKHPKFDPSKHHISLVESKRVAGGASGKAGGLLALWAFPLQLVPLSFELHQKLSDLYDGEKEWDYRRLTTLSIEGDISGVPDEVAEDEGFEKPEHSKSIKNGDKPPKKTLRATSVEDKKILPPDLTWMSEELVTGCHSLGGKDTTAQVHPYKFTNFLLRKAVEDSDGALELILGKVNKVLYLMETGGVTGIQYEPTSVKAAQSEQALGPIRLNGDQVVLSVGPWTSKILPDCPISGLRAHSITVEPFKSESVSPYAIFTEYKAGKDSYVSPEIYARKDEVYVCGEGDSAVDVPETTDDVEVVKSKCDDIFRQAGKMSPMLRNGRILKRQACYLPVLDVPSSSGPLIGETNVENLYLCSGHSCWGINNAPGSGKIMSELLLDGRASSANISSLDPSLYFDASVLVSDDEDDDEYDEDDDEYDEDEEAVVDGE
ncbi:FAD dependent oxidoreductase [Metschnikowia bicuspidata var. bicuspidata NRRL YB-4993]|uniref:FAD dependent oxidoreductase n=1 Tax=Metschnikowia bicuspidata var. bicuspidata NRRL YB-4993 TaxID=869754 RepID=A0A1A0H6L3_9ASCO|nr:FAD dependent oxidoreductase [Metschnikowia bicuspidata var. bicuspidata NRRL YB-4993]OBA19600.1 FAD dependent oxidoreductase [Metschnikowia bicuspidata var. bicuspidata NRRL YB-4993]